MHVSWSLFGVIVVPALRRVALSPCPIGSQRGSRRGTHVPNSHVSTPGTLGDVAEHTADKCAEQPPIHASVMVNTNRLFPISFRSIERGAPSSLGFAVLA